MDMIVGKVKKATEVEVEDSGKTKSFVVGYGDEVMIVKKKRGEPGLSVMWMWTMPGCLGLLALLLVGAFFLTFR